MKTPEAHVKDDIKKYLKQRGAYFFMPVQVGYGQATLDILACVDGYFVAIECKREGALPTARQDQKLKEIRAAGGLAFCAWSLNDVLTALALLPRSSYDSP